MSIDTALTGTKIHRDAIVIDTCGFYFRGYTDQVEESGATAIVCTTSSTSADFEEAVAGLERHHRFIEADPARLLHVKSAADIRAAKAAGKVGAVFGVQNARPVGEDLGRVRTLWRLGLRVIQLTYMYRNLYGDGCLEPANGGMSRLGRRLVQEVNANRLLLDLAHVGERTSIEAIEASTLPSVISHANPRGLIPNPRNITDDQIRAVVRANGVCGVCGWSPILYRESQGSRPPDERDIADCIQYIADLVGVDHVGVGTDSPASGIGTAESAEHAKEVNAAFPDVTGPYVRNIGEKLEHRYGVSLWKLPKLTAELVRRGFSAEDVGKIMGGNFLRVFEQVWI